MPGTVLGTEDTGENPALMNWHNCGVRENILRQMVISVMQKNTAEKDVTEAVCNFK